MIFLFVQRYSSQSAGRSPIENPRLEFGVVGDVMPCDRHYKSW
jgi:hypothetical protein